MKREFMVFAVLLLIAAVTWYLTDTASSVLERPSDPTTSDEPDVYGRDIELTQFNADGTLHYHLNASVIRQYNNEELTRMTSPDLHLTNPDRRPWDIQSKRGYMRKSTSPQGTPEDVVYLRESVRMTRAHPQHGPITMRSEAMDIFPDRQYAETDQDVMIDTDIGSTEAGGLRVDLESGRLHLSSGRKLRVHTIVLPEHFKKT